MGNPKIGGNGNYRMPSNVLENANVISTVPFFAYTILGFFLRRKEVGFFCIQYRGIFPFKFKKNFNWHSSSYTVAQFWGHKFGQSANFVLFLSAGDLFSNFQLEKCEVIPFFKPEISFFERIFCELYDETGEGEK